MIPPQNKRNDNQSRAIGRAQAQLAMMRILINEAADNLANTGASDGLIKTFDSLWLAYLESENSLEKELANP